MEIPRDVWRWLCSVGAVASVRASKQASSDPNVVRVDQQTQAAMEVRPLFVFLLGATSPFVRTLFTDLFLLFFPLVLSKQWCVVPTFSSVSVPPHQIDLARPTRHDTTTTTTTTPNTEWNGTCQSARTN